MKRLALLVALAACGKGAGADYIAVGWTGAAPTSMGPCKPGAYGAVTPIQSTGYGTLLAVTPGDMAFDCRDGALTVHVVAPTQLAIAPVAAQKGVPVVVTASVSAGSQSLALGDSAIGWTFPTGLRQTEACSRGTCVKPSSARFVADAAGTYEINAQFGTLTATAKIVVN